MSRKIIDIANSLDFVKDYNGIGITGNNARISTSENGELALYSGTSSTNSTTGTVILYNGGLSINSTAVSTSYTAGGALTVRGGVSIGDKLYVGSDVYVATNISSSTLTVSGLTAGNINFTGDLYKNGSLYVSSQWSTGTGGALSYTDGNVGIGITSPAYSLDVSGTVRSTNILTTVVTSTNIIGTNTSTGSLNVTELTSGNINFTGNLYQNGSLYISSQWTTGSGGILSYTDGAVGIGTTAPTSTLSVIGNLNISGGSTISTISASRTGDVLDIINVSSSGNSSIGFKDSSSSYKIHIGYANAGSSLTNLIGNAYILSENTVSIKIAASNHIGVPVIINAADNSVSITTTTDASDIYSGSLKVSGGVGIANSLYVGDDVHLNRDLYVEGAINGAAASSSTFAYMTLTSTDDAINLSTGSLVTFGGITVQTTADAESSSNGGGLLVQGGAAIGKKLYVGDGLITDLISTSNMVVDTITSGNVLATNLSFGLSHMYSGSFVPSNNVTTLTDVVGLVFSSSDVRSFSVTLSTNVIATENLYETFILEGIQTEGDWILYVSSYGDTTDITFDITNAGQIQYTTPNYTGFSDIIFRYHVSVINKTGTYSYPGSDQSTLIVDTIQILNTEDSNIGTNNGGLYLLGGCTISKTVCSANVSTGNLRATNMTVSNLINNSITAGSINIQNGGTFGSIYVSGNATFGSNVVIGGPVLKIPTGDIASRPVAPVGGHVRYNTETQQFEGYGPGNAWGSLGGVVDIAQTTKILASGSPSTTDGNLYFYTVGTERMRINSTGNVGIGTTSPGVILDVVGTASISSSLTTGSLYTTHLYATNYTTTNANIIYGTVGSLVSTSMSTGTIIATTYTGGSMNLSGDLTLAGTLTTVNITTTNLVDTNVSAGTLTASTINITTGTVGTLVSSNANVTTQTVGTSRITTSLLAVGNSNTVGSIFTTGGNVGIGTSSPSSILQVSNFMQVDSSGNLLASGDMIAFSSISDIRLKDNICSIDSESALNVINFLNPVTFTWKDDIYNHFARGKDDVGFIAQEVEEIIPYAVTEFSEIESGNVYKRMKHERIIPYLVSALKKLSIENERKTEQIQRLVETIELLTEKVNSILYINR